MPRFILVLKINP